MWRRLGNIAICLAVSWVAAIPALAAGDVGNGKVLADTCKGCHFIANYKNSYPVFHVPKLGGQNGEYVSIALHGYASGERAHDTMHSQAATMTDQDIADVSAYLASLGDLEAAASGSGKAPDQAAACVACHGEYGVSVMEQYPNLAGQHADYLAHALKQYRSGKRTNAVMAGFAGQLSDADIEVLAAFFASQKGLFTPER